MSVMTLRTLLCDYGEDCETEPPFVSISLTVTRAEAAKAGWTHSAPDTDYCPTHTKEPA